MAGGAFKTRMAARGEMMLACRKMALEACYNARGCVAAIKFWRRLLAVQRVCEARPKIVIVVGVLGAASACAK